MDEFVEYPKWVKLESGEEVIVQSKEEEDALIKPVPASKKSKD